MYSTFLRQKIDESGKTQKDIANSAGITTAALANYLNGSRSPQLEVAKKLCDACGYDLIFVKKGSINVDTKIEDKKPKKSTNVDIDIDGAIELSNTPAPRLAQLMGVNTAILDTWRTGASTPTLEQLVNLFNLTVALGLSARHAPPKPLDTAETTDEPAAPMPPAQATA